MAVLFEIFMNIDWNSNSIPLSDATHLVPRVQRKESTFHQEMMALSSVSQELRIAATTLLL